MSHEPFPKNTRVRVTEQRDPDDAPVGKYTVESFQGFPELQIEGETFTPRYWLSPLPYDGLAYTAPPDVVVLDLEVIRGG